MRGKSAVGPRGAGPNRAGPNTEGPNEDSLNIVDSSETGLNTADSNSTGPAGIGHIVLRLDRIMVERGRSLNWLADQVGITNVNLSKIKNNRVSAIRFFRHPLFPPSPPSVRHWIASPATFLNMWMAFRAMRTMRIASNRTHANSSPPGL